MCPPTCVALRSRARPPRARLTPCSWPHSSSSLSSRRSRPSPSSWPLLHRRAPMRGGAQMRREGRRMTTLNAQHATMTAGGRTTASAMMVATAVMRTAPSAPTAMTAACHSALSRSGAARRCLMSMGGRGWRAAARADATAAARARVKSRAAGPRGTASAGRATRTTKRGAAVHARLHVEQRRHAHLLRRRLLLQELQQRLR